MMKFEYKLLALDTRAAEVELNKLGGEGWEVTGFFEASTALIRVILKRAVSSDKQFMAGV